MLLATRREASRPGSKSSYYFSSSVFWFSFVLVIFPHIWQCIVFDNDVLFYLFGTVMFVKIILKLIGTSRIIFKRCNWNFWVSSDRFQHFWPILQEPTISSEGFLWRWAWKHRPVVFQDLYKQVSDTGNFLCFTSKWQDRRKPNMCEVRKVSKKKIWNF